MIAVLVHEVVRVTLVLFSKLLHDSLDVLLCEVCTPENDSLSEADRTEENIYWLSL